MGSTGPHAIIALAGTFAAEAAANGPRPPLRLLDGDARAWPLLDRAGDLLVLDSYGELWWARPCREGEVRTFRAVWPEELHALREAIERAIAVIRARACHPAGGASVARRVDGPGARA